MSLRSRRPEVSDVRAVYAIPLSEVRRALRIGRVEGSEGKVRRVLEDLLLRPENFLDVLDEDEHGKPTRLPPTKEVWRDLLNSEPPQLRVTSTHLMIECAASENPEAWMPRANAQGVEKAREFVVAPSVLPKGLLGLRPEWFALQIVVRTTHRDVFAVVTDSGGRELVPESKVRVADRDGGEGARKTVMLFYRTEQCFLITMTDRGNAVINKYGVAKRPNGEYFMSREVVAALPLTQLYLTSATSDDEVVRAEGVGKVHEEFRMKVATSLYDQLVPMLIKAYWRTRVMEDRDRETRQDLRRERDEARRDAEKRARQAKRDAGGTAGERAVDKTREPINVPEARATEVEEDGASQPPSAEQVDAEAVAAAALAEETPPDADGSKDSAAA